MESFKKRRDDFINIENNQTSHSKEKLEDQLKNKQIPESSSLDTEFKTNYLKLLYITNSEHDIEPIISILK